jgi:UDP-3-O-[3-hydroxymyristoyl] glucosamine N-acyltransferase
MSYDLRYLAKLCGAELCGDPEKVIAGISSLERAAEDQITFCLDSKHLEQLKATRAGAVIVNNKIAEAVNGNALISNNPHLAFAIVAQALHPPAQEAEGIADSAVVAVSADIAENARIGPNVTIESGATIGENVQIGAGSFIGADVVIGNGTRIRPNVVIENRCEIGSNCLIQPGAVIGGDGFGFARNGDAWEKIPQVGRVIIKDNVEIGANTTIDRGAIEDTVIHQGVKIDNLVMIAHNVEVGENTAIAALAGIAGSAVVGKRCSIGGQVGIFGHITLTDDVVVAATSLVRRSIKEPGVYSGSVFADRLDKWQRNHARLVELDSLARRLIRLEKEYSNDKE